MKFRRSVAAGALGAVAALASTVALAVPASAADKPAAKPSAERGAVAAAAYNGVCGAGYTVIDSTPVGSAGTVYLTYNKNTGKNCAVTVRNTTGAKTYMRVTLTAQTGDNPDDWTERTDAGEYTSYAGPVYVDARGVCVSWEGGIDNVWVSDSGHCG